MYLFSQIHEIVFHGNGGYDWGTVYEMPIWLRKFTFNKIQEHFTHQQEEYEKQQNQLKNRTELKPEIARPGINQNPQNTYSYKAPKK